VSKFKVSDAERDRLWTADSKLAALADELGVRDA
jgi:hypothetical protein